MLFRLTVVNNRNAWCKIDYPPSPLQLRKSAKVSPPLPTNQCLVNRYLPWYFEIRLYSDFDVTTQGVSYQAIVRSRAYVPWKFLCNCSCRPLYPKDYCFVKCSNIETRAGRSHIDVLFSKAKIADPKVVVLGLIQTMLHGHLAVAKVAIAPVVNETRRHPVINHFDLRP